MHRKTAVGAVGLTLAALTLGACQAPRYRTASLPQVEASLPEADFGELTNDRAIRLLIERNPELCALRAEIRAVDLDPRAFGATFDLKVADGEVGDVMIGADALSLLGYGPRPAAQALGRAIRHEAILRHHERARALVGELQIAIARRIVLDGSPPWDVPFDLDAFREAGLLSEATDAAMKGVLSENQAERALQDAERRAIHTRIAELLGARPTDELNLDYLQTENSAAPAEPSERALLLARGDLQRLLARTATAERAYRLALQEQLPNVVLKLGGDMRLDLPLQMIAVRLPLDAPHKVRVARRVRDAAHARLRDGVHGAMHEAAQAAIAHEAAIARRQAIEGELAAVGGLLQAEQARLETDPVAINAMVLLAGRIVRARRGLREAKLAEFTAGIRKDIARGLPTAESLEAVR